ncbi:MAG: precorrin-2 C(20)-methyltransferase [Nitrosopumilus sp.]|nr:precorrin-2 C(20)-methyltransferase [Nitrosopumilus sp.]CAI9832543.1 Precorrin-2 C20-methylase [Nitrosopumilaceae archaeon]MDA7941035.1 precorrin-2 C(20)-methyltransferase [Nitrosopumilus sp.]MDA7942567.1 precorrin-2 C(20)-methyltransferase [Nitrosopumilus sp.]MDA7944472.1 precorrin-2 C(20)-methyltransferase [Nitrosopumilus sp.]
MAGIVGIGVGPGDPELLTVKAERVIRGADVVMCPASAEDRPSIALSCVSHLVGDTEVVKLVFPMTRDEDVLRESWERNAEIMAGRALAGDDIAYVTVGDPHLYSTWIYMERRIRERHPSVSVESVPGIVSMFAFAAKVGVSIAEGAEKVAIIPSCYDLSAVREIARNAESLVFLKDGRYFDSVIEVLGEAGFPDDSVFAVGQDIGTPDELISRMTLADARGGTLASKYFSILVVKRA